MKKLINDPANVVREELQGIEAAHGDLVKVFYDPYYITRADSPVQGKVALISGGGSGHEPMHGGFVGTGHARRRRVPVRSSPPPRPTRWRRPPRPSTAARASCTS